MRLDFAARDACEIEGLRVSVHYEMYDGIPLMQKWISVHNASERAHELQSFEADPSLRDRHFSERELTASR